QLDEATALYQRVLEREPKDANAHLRLADTLFEANEPAKARYHYEQALALHPELAAAHLGLGRIAATTGHHREAITHFERTLALQPGATEAHYPLAIALRQTGELQRAEEHLERQGPTEVATPDSRLAAITALGRGHGYHRLRGEVALADERCEEAAASFELAIAEVPGDRDARAGLAAALRQCGDFEAAISQLLMSHLAGPTATAVAVDRDAGAAFELPRRPSVEALEAPVRHRLGALHEAAEQALDSGRLDHAATHLGHLAQLYLAYGLDDASRHHFLAARQLSPTEPIWGYFLGVLEQTRDPLEARRELRAFLDQYSNDAAAWMRLGQTELELGESPAAEAALRRALELDQDNAAAAFGLGRIYLERGQPEAAVAWLEKALSQQPDAGRVHHVYGQTLRRLGELDRARSHLARANDRDVRFEDPSIDRLGEVLTLTAFEVVLAMASNPAVSLEDHLGYSLSKLGSVEGAAEKLSGALRLGLASVTQRAEARLHYVAGGLWVRRALDDRAAEHFRKALEIEPTLLEARVKLGNIAARGGDWTTAVSDYRAALEQHPDHRPALRKRATAYAALGDLSRATADLERLVALDPHDAAARIQLARATEQAGDVATASELLRAAPDSSAEDRAAIATAQGDMAQRRRAFEQAIDHYRMALEGDPGAAGARLQLAATLGHLGRLAEAEQHYGRLLELVPDHIAGRLGRATCLVLLGRYDETRELLEEGLIAVPGDLAFSHFLARLLASAPSAELRDGERAVALALAVYRRQASPQAAETVAMAFAEAGQFQDARKWQRRLIDQAKGQPENLMARLRPQL
ncbi:MAG: tetratricopeptide repeat protein, partial [Acidobacteriota bacterium]